MPAASSMVKNSQGALLDAQIHIKNYKKLQAAMKKVSSRHMRGAFEKWARASQLLLATSSTRTAFCEPSFRELHRVHVTWRAIFAKAIEEGGILCGRGQDRKRQDGPAACEGQGSDCLLIVYPYRKCNSWTHRSSDCVSHRERNSYIVYVRHHETQFYSGCKWG